MTPPSAAEYGGRMDMKVAIRKTADGYAGRLSIAGEPCATFASAARSEVVAGLISAIARHRAAVMADFDRMIDDALTAEDEQA